MRVLHQTNPVLHRIHINIDTWTKLVIKKIVFLKVPTRNTSVEAEEDHEESQPGFKPRHVTINCF
jgi:hypothetical protein